MLLSSPGSTGNEKLTVLEQLYLEYRHGMFNVAFAILQDHGLTEDAVQTAFLNLAKKSQKIDDVFSKKTKGFMLVVARNAALDMLRRGLKAQFLSIDHETLQLVDDQPLPLDIIINNEIIDKLRSFLATLDPKYADIILLKYYNDFSCTDIAKLLGVSIETVRTRLRRAKKMLAEKIIEGDLDDAQPYKRR